MRWALRAMVVTSMLAFASEADANFAFKVGAQYEVKPKLPEDDAWAFAAAFISEYAFAGPISFEFGSSFAVNGTYFDWTIVEAGLLAKFPVGQVVPTFRAAFVFDWRQFFKEQPTSTSNFLLGANFGPGIRFLFGKSGRGISLDVGFLAGRFMREPKDAFFAILPMIGFVF